MEFAELLSALGRSPDDLICILERQHNKSGLKRLGFVKVGEAQAFVSGLAGDIYFSVNPLDPEKVTQLEPGQRGDSRSVASLTILYADLDSKENGLGSEERCTAFVDRLSEVLGVEPVAVVHTGTGGMHPYWKLDQPITASTLRAWGVLVKKLAAEFGGHVDSVFDAARVLRVPGIVRANGELVRLELKTRGIVSAPNLTSLVAEYMITTEKASAIDVAFENWKPAVVSCPYVWAMIDGWESETNVHDRHHWLLNKMNRLMASARLGCISTEDFNIGQKVAIGKFRSMLRTQEPVREEHDNEVMGIVDAAREATERKTEEWLREQEVKHDDCLNQDKTLNDLVEREYNRLVARDRAKERYQAEKAAQGAYEPFNAGYLADLEDEDTEQKVRIEKLVPWEGNTLIAAQNKTGKTTLCLQLAEALITGGKMFGALTVEQLAPDENIGFLNYEVSQAKIVKDAKSIGVPLDRLYLVTLRARGRNPLGHEGDRKELATMLRAANVRTLIVDPFSKAFTGENPDSVQDVNRFLKDLEYFARTQVGALDLIVTAHMGWNGDHTRGSSALEDWPDNKVYLKKQAGGVVVSTEGRMDEKIEPSSLLFDELTKRSVLNSDANVREQREDALNRARFHKMTQFMMDHASEYPEGFPAGKVQGTKNGTQLASLIALEQLGFVERTPKDKWVLHKVFPEEVSLGNGLIPGLTLA